MYKVSKHQPSSQFGGHENRWHNIDQITKNHCKNKILTTQTKHSSLCPNVYPIHSFLALCLHWKFQSHDEGDLVIYTTPFHDKNNKI